MKNTSKVLLISVLAAFMTSMISVANASDDLSLFPKPIAQMKNAKQVVGIYFLPELEDSELGMGGKEIPTTGGDSHNSSEKCTAYKYSKNGASGTTTCSSPKSLYNACPFDPSKFLSCTCNKTSYPYDNSNCILGGTRPGAPDILLAGNRCNDVNGINSSICACIPALFQYTSDASCGDSNKELDPAIYCYTKSDPTKRYSSCKCKAEFNLTAAKNRAEGWTCTSCTDGTTKYKCEATACPSGSSVNQSCSTNQTPADTEYKSGGEMCQTCQSNNNCGYFWNADGSKTIPTGKCNWRGLGAYATIYSQVGPYTSVWVQFWQNSTVNNDFETSELRLGNVRSSWGSAYTDPRTYTFNGKVTVNGKLLVERSNTSYNFKGGICGTFTCHNTDNSGNIIGTFTCPAKSANCKFSCDQNNYWNGNGLKTIPTSWCHISGYGSDNETVIQGSEQRFANVDWTFTEAFIRGGKIVTDRLVVGVHGGGMQTNARFANAVEVNEEIIINNDSTIAFPGGISGTYTCFRSKNGTKTAINCPFVCSQDNYFNGNGTHNPYSSQCSINGYGSTNTTNIPSGGLHVEMGQWTFSSATVNGGPLYINGRLIAGIHGGGMTSRITFNVPVKMSGDIILYQDSSLVFNRGITGAYKCFRQRGSSRSEISCPF